jgi:hypothetical protein
MFRQNDAEEKVAVHNRDWFHTRLQGHMSYGIHQSVQLSSDLAQSGDLAPHLEEYAVDDERDKTRKTRRSIDETCGLAGND